LAGVGASGAALLGERIVSPVFGAQGVLSAGDHALAAGLTMLAVVSITLTMAVTGLNDPKTLVTVWPVAAVLGIGTIVVGGLGPSAALVSLVSAESIVVVGLAASLWYRMDGSSGEREMALGFPRD
jgi:hypothetical protein